MNMVPWITQQISPTFLLVTSTYTWKLLVVLHNVSMEIMKDTTESFITLLDQAFLTVINMKINGDLQKIHQQKYIYANYILH